MSSDSHQKLRIHIRWMIRRDMPEILEIEKQSFEFPWCEEDFIRCLRQRNCIGMVRQYPQLSLRMRLFVNIVLLLMTNQNLAWAEIGSIATRVLWNFDMELSAESERWLDQKMWSLWDKKPLMVKLKNRIRT